MAYQTSGARKGSRPPKRYAGSRRRLQRIRLRGNSSWELWLLIGWIAFLLLGVIPWMIRQTR